MTVTVPISDQRVLTLREFNHLKMGEGRLYYVGAIGYRDAEQNLRQTAFCRYFNGPINLRANPPLFGAFKIDANPDYEYRD
jgi:hypothetical protein